MLQFNPNHKGNRLSVEVVSNGYIVEINGASFNREQIICKNFYDVVYTIGRELGVISGDEMVILQGKSEDE